MFNLNSLTKALGGYDWSSLESHLYAGLDRLKKVFGAYFTSLEDEGDNYVLTLDVAEDAKASNVTVDYDDDTRELSVEYKYDGDNFSNRSFIKEVLPKDADEDDINATVEDGKLTIIIGKLVDVEYPEEEVDDTVVKVNRKNK